MDWNLILLVGGGLLMILTGQLPWAKLLGWFKGLFSGKPAPEVTSSVQEAVTHWWALKGYCKDCPEAQNALAEVWKHLPEGHKE
jgi:hypothetical protein